MPTCATAGPPSAAQGPGRRSGGRRCPRTPGRRRPRSGRASSDAASRRMAARARSSVMTLRPVAAGIPSSTTPFPVDPTLHDPSAVGGSADSMRQTDRVAHETRANPPRPGAASVRMPGVLGPALGTRQLAERIVLHPTIAPMLEDCARRYGLEFPALLGPERSGRDRGGSARGPVVVPAAVEDVTGSSPAPVPGERGRRCGMRANERRMRPKAASAEAVRFELTDGCPSPVFKTGAIDHSATLPCEAGDSRVGAPALGQRGPAPAPARSAPASPRGGRRRRAPR